MSLLPRFLDDAQRAVLSKRVTSNGVRLEDVIRSGQRHPDSSIGIYAPDFQSYEIFRELFDPILLHFRAPSQRGRNGPIHLNRKAVVSTRIRVARNLAGHMFPAGMSSPERLSVQAKITRACEALAPEFPGWTRKLGGIPRHRLDALISKRLAFGPEDKYMVAAGVHADWPLGRSVFTT